MIHAARALAFLAALLLVAACGAERDFSYAYEVPDDLPLYPGSEPAASEGFVEGEGVRVFATHDALGEVLRFYREAPRDLDWVVEAESEIEGRWVLSVVKGRYPLRRGSITLRRNNGTTQIALATWLLRH